MAILRFLMSILSMPKTELAEDDDNIIMPEPVRMEFYLNDALAARIGGENA